MKEKNSYAVKFSSDSANEWKGHRLEIELFLPDEEIKFIKYGKLVGEVCKNVESSETSDLCWQQVGQGRVRIQSLHFDLFSTLSISTFAGTSSDSLQIVCENMQTRVGESAYAMFFDKCESQDECLLHKAIRLRYSQNGHWSRIISDQELGFDLSLSGWQWKCLKIEESIGAPPIDDPGNSNPKWCKGNDTRVMPIESDPDVSEYLGQTLHRCVT